MELNTMTPENPPVSALSEAVTFLDEIAQRPDQKPRVQYVARYLAALRQPRALEIPEDLLQDLLSYGWVSLIEGVIYGKPHRERLRELQEWLTAEARKRIRTSFCPTRTGGGRE